MEAAPLPRPAARSVSVERVAVLAPEPIRPRMAGMGIRALELARALSARFAVRLIVPNDAAEAREVAGALEVAAAKTGGLAEAARGVDAAVVSGHAASAWFHEVPGRPGRRRSLRPVSRREPPLRPEPRRRDGAARPRDPGPGAGARGFLPLRLRRAAALLRRRPVRVGPHRRVELSGRPGARGAARDRAVRRAGRRPRGAIEPPGAAPRAFPEAVPSCSSAASTTGTTRDRSCEAWPAIAAREPQARLLFFENPNPASTPQGAFERARRRAREIDPRGESIFFSPWLPYGSRAGPLRGGGPRRLDRLGGARDRARLPHASARCGLGRRAVDRGGRRGARAGAGRGPAAGSNAAAALPTSRNGSEPCSATRRRGEKAAAAAKAFATSPDLEGRRGTARDLVPLRTPGSGTDRVLARRAPGGSASSSNLPSAVADPPEASIVVVHHRGLEHLLEALEALEAVRRRGLHAEVLLVDNASDTPLDAVLARHPDVRRIRSSVNAGFASGCRLGVEAAASRDGPLRQRRRRRRARCPAAPRRRPRRRAGGRRGGGRTADRPDGNAQRLLRRVPDLRRTRLRGGRSGVPSRSCRRRSPARSACSRAEA